MSAMQKGILAPVPRVARYLHFALVPGARPVRAMRALRILADGDATVVGVGDSLARALDARIEGLGVFPAAARSGVEIPSTPSALWCWLRGDDRGELVHRTRKLAGALAPDLAMIGTIDAFKYESGRDLTGYEDGTENPKGKRAIDVAAQQDGSSFVAVQQWVHQLDRFESMSRKAQDDVIGRRRTTNTEFATAPPSAHVKRTAQESFEPPAFVLRRSMPWAAEGSEGLVFVAFGRSFHAFEALLHRMMGDDDGIVDALFGFTRPVSGAYFWCPPVRNGRLDLSALGV